MKRKRVIGGTCNFDCRPFRFFAYLTAPILEGVRNYAKNKNNFMDFKYFGIVY
nr:MAG TPA: hypothetical protein [Caudoviricetes sp.]